MDSFNNFDVTTFKENSSIAVVGKRATGKTFLIGYIAEILLNNKVDECIVVSLPTYNHTEFYSNLGVTICEYNNTLIENILKKQEQESKKLLLVFEDSVHDNEFNMDKVLNELFFSHKQYGISLIYSTQRADDSLKLGFGFDYVILARENYISEQKRLYNFFGGMFPTLDLFKETFCQLTQDYNMMLINNTCDNNNLYEKIQWIRAENVNPDFDEDDD
jgi:hypothetical protein